MKRISDKPFYVEPLWLSSHTILFLTIMLWYIPYTNNLLREVDKETFFVLNGSLNHHGLWLSFWGILNHRKEVTINLFIAACFNIWAILATSDPLLKKIRIKQSVYFWICFQLGFMLQDYVFNHFIRIIRYSPSLVLHPVLKLSVALQDPQIKDFSEHSFPGGHAFSLIFWGAFTKLCAPKYIANLGLFFAILFCLPRLFSGAHWLSDVVFSGLLALIWLSWTIHNPLYKRIIKSPNLI